MLTVAHWMICAASGFAMARAIRYDDALLFGAGMVSLLITMFLIGRNS